MMNAGVKGVPISGENKATPNQELPPDVESLTPGTAADCNSKLSQNRLQAAANRKKFIFDHLDKNKNIHDDYEIGELLGSGSYG